MFEIYEGVGLPQPLAKFVPGDNLARTFEQCREYLSRLLLEPYALPLPVEFAGDNVELEQSELEALMFLAVHGGGPRV